MKKLILIIYSVHQKCQNYYEIIIVYGLRDFFLQNDNFIFVIFLVKVIDSKSSAI